MKSLSILAFGSRTICLDKSQRFGHAELPRDGFGQSHICQGRYRTESRHEHLERSICHLRRWDVRDNRLEDRCQAG